jgi:hypothetical protein
MEIKHVNGKSVETDKLPDVDAILMEESQKLHAIFKKYNRQLFLVGEMKSREDSKTINGCVFFHVMPEDPEGKPVDPQAYQKASGYYWGRVDGYVRSMTNHRLGIGVIPPPQVEPYPPEYQKPITE